ncbi:MAG: hypothetical protein QM811_24590 [Pirellulales bacterium]
MTADKPPASDPPDRFAALVRAALCDPSPDDPAPSAALRTAVAEKLAALSTDAPSTAETTSSDAPSVDVPPVSSLPISLSAVQEPPVVRPPLDVSTHTAQSSSKVPMSVRPTPSDPVGSSRSPWWRVGVGVLVAGLAAAVVIMLLPPSSERNEDARNEIAAAGDRSPQHKSPPISQALKTKRPPRTRSIDASEPKIVSRSPAPKRRRP